MTVGTASQHLKAFPSLACGTFKGPDNATNIMAKTWIFPMKDNLI